MSFDYQYVLNPTGQVDNHILREMFDDIKDYLNTSLSGEAPADASYVTLSTNASLSAERVLTGTANQVIITDNGAGSTVVLSLPQSIATSSNVQFNSLRLSQGNLTDPAIFWNVTGTEYGIDLENAGNFRFSSNGAEAANITGIGSRFNTFVATVSFVLQNTGGSPISITGPGAGGGNTWTFPSTTASRTFASQEQDETFSGVKTFSSAVTITPTTNQLVLGTTRTATITAPTPASSSRTYTFPDLTGNYDVVGTIGTQSIAGAKTFSNAVTITTSTANTLVVSTDQSTTEVSIDNTASDGDPFLSWKLGGTKQFSLGVNDGASDVLQLGTTAIDTGTMWQATAAGEITQALQPSFLVTNGTGASNVTGDGTAYTVLWPTEVFDQGSDFASNTFTAPVTGRYYLQAAVMADELGTAHNSRKIEIVTSNRTYKYEEIGTTLPAYTFKNYAANVLADMDANDTATIVLTVSGSTKVIDVDANATNNYFSGSLIN